ncbi:chorismate mutase family protein [Rhizobium sp. TRM96647]|uniref:chorismate mutase family protein n=1 Tax=unclassified Rhizobium TaxID=2613769 RepID=UPI0021E75AAD|nr:MULTISPECIES: chorismate mutase family protein [unclassified Rhizobium]MCV3737214.1 chorismate mutase family protein [Rhizobium sp. TRM96647]MCV3759198.1 chorismate mutase family protein [Rhizobium sp. TRM96650]
MSEKAADCRTMAEIRDNIDRIDRALMDLFAERWTFIGRAAEIKAELGLKADIPARVDEVRNNARENALARGLDGDFYDGLWAQLIRHSIEHEEVTLGK